MHRFIPYDPTFTERFLVAIGPLWRWCARHFPKRFSPDEPAPHPSAMLDDPNRAYKLIFPRFFKRIGVDEEGVERINEAASSATVVYVTKYVGQLEYNYFNHLFTERGLPLTAYCNSLTLRRWMKPRYLWRSIGTQEKQIAEFDRPLDPLVDDQLVEMIASGQSVMLRIPQTDLEEEHIVHSTPLKGLREIVEAQRKSEKPIVIVPLDFLWSRRPPKESRSLVDLLFGEKEEPGKIRKFVLFWRNYKRRAQASLGSPIDVKKLIEENPSASDEEIANSLRRTLKSAIRLQRRTITGPPIRARAAIIQEVLADDKLDEVICRLATDSDKPVDAVRDLAHKYAKEIVSDLDYTYVELLERLLGKTLVRLFESFNVDTEGLARAKKLSQQGPLVFVPNHKSHADYLILSYVLYHHGMNVPFITAGKNLAFWPLGRIFRRCGAYFIRRSFRGNELYEAVLRTYLKVLLVEGHSQEFFIEGSRSRTGKLKNPRTGMLRMLQRATREGGIENMTYIPVSITYDRVIEQKSYMRELTGGQKEDEKRSHLLKLTKFMKRKKPNYGSIYIRFGNPIPSNDVGEDAKDIEALALGICHEINRGIVVTPVSIAAAALLSSPDKGVTFPRFRQSASALLAGLTAKGIEIPRQLAEAPFALLQGAAEKLSGQKLVSIHGESLEPFISIEEGKRIPLSYFRNGIVHFLVTIGVVCRLIRQHAMAGRAPTLDQLAFDLGAAKELLFREFRFATSRPLGEHAARVIDFLVNQEAVSISESGGIAMMVKGSSLMGVFEAQILPSIERIWVATRVVVERMKTVKEERALINDMLECGGDMYLLGKIKFRETVTKDGFRNAIATLIDFGLIKAEPRKPGSKKRNYLPSDDEESAKRLKVELEKFI